MTTKPRLSLTGPEPDPDWHRMLRLMDLEGFHEVRQVLIDLIRTQPSSQRLSRVRTHILNMERSPNELAFLFVQVAQDIGVMQ